MTGSIRIARLAGIYDATNAMAASSELTAMKVNGSRVSTPNSKARISSDSSNAAAIPIVRRPRSVSDCRNR